MPGSYSVSDIFRYFFPGFLIVFLIGITSTRGLAIVSKAPAFTVLSAFIIGTIYYNGYRYIYGLIRYKKACEPVRKSELLPAEAYLRKEFTNYLNINKPSISIERINKFYDDKKVYHFVNRHFVESNEYHRSYQNKRVSGIHLNYMTSSILFIYLFVIYSVIIISKLADMYGCNFGVLIFDYHERNLTIVILSIILIILCILSYLNAQYNDNIEESQEILYLVVQDKDELFCRLSAFLIAEQ